MGESGSDFLVLRCARQLLFAGVQIHELSEEARIQHLFERVREFDSPSLTSARKSLAFKRIDKDHARLRPLDLNDPPSEFYDQLNFCDDLGLLTERGALNRHDVWSEFSYWIFPIYADARPLIDAEQKDSPAVFRECSNLVESIRSIEIREDASADDHPSEDDIYSYYSNEVEDQSGQSTRKGKLAGKR